MESRLKRRSLKQSKKQLYGSLIAIAIIIFIFLNFGPYVLGRLGELIDVVTNKGKQAARIVSDADLQPPIIDPIPAATPSSSITVTGRSFYQEGKIELFVNDLRYQTAILDDSYDFEFKNVALGKEENTIKARAVLGRKKSEFSQVNKVSYVKDPPKLEISSPTDGQSFTKDDKETTIHGMTDPDVTIRVNDFIAVVDVNGNFSYIYSLKEGENKIKITAENVAKKTTTKEITLSYSP